MPGTGENRVLSELDGAKSRIFPAFRKTMSFVIISTTDCVASAFDGLGALWVTNNGALQGLKTARNATLFLRA